MEKRGFVPVVALFLAAAAVLGGAYYINEQGTLSNVQINVQDGGALTGTTSGDSVGQATASSTSAASAPVSSVSPSPSASARINAGVNTRANTQAQGNVLLPNTGTNITTANQARTTTQAATPANTELFNELTSTGAFTITLRGDGGIWREGGTYSILWSPRNNVASRRYHDFKVELIEVGRIDRGPVLIASYSNTKLSDIPRTVNFTLPTSMNQNTWYAIRVTYKTSNENYFGDDGYKGSVYIGTSPSFKVGSANGVVTNTELQRITEATLKATSVSFSQPSMIHEKTTNVPFLRFRLAATGDDVTVTHFALGSPSGNDIFNYVENVKANVNGQLIHLQFSNEYLLGTTLWKLDSPIVINEGGSATVTIVADIKPGIKDTSLRAALKGGRANALFSTHLLGPTVEVD